MSTRKHILFVDFDHDVWVIRFNCFVVISFDCYYYCVLPFLCVERVATKFQLETSKDNKFFVSEDVNVWGSMQSERKVLLWSLHGVEYYTICKKYQWIFFFNSHTSTMNLIHIFVCTFLYNFQSPNNNSYCCRLDIPNSTDFCLEDLVVTYFPKCFQRFVFVGWSCKSHVFNMIFHKYVWPI